MSEVHSTDFEVDSPSAGVASPELPQPFSLRGHHIRKLTELIGPMACDAGVLAAKEREFAVAQRGSLRSQTADFSILESLGEIGPAAEVWWTYSLDLVGDTDRQAKAFEEGLRTTFEKFLALPDDARVKLTTGKPDGICDACTFRQHCVLPFQAKADAEVIEVFKDVVQHFAQRDELLDPFILTEGDGSLLTSAGTLRRVIGYFALGEKNADEYYADALRRQRNYGGVFRGPGMPEVEANLLSEGT